MQVVVMQVMMQVVVLWMCIYSNSAGTAEEDQEVYGPLTTN
jgi:hypothetical protein